MTLRLSPAMSAEHCVSRFLHRHGNMVASGGSHRSPRDRNVGAVKHISSRAARKERKIEGVGDSKEETYRQLIQGHFGLKAVLNPIGQSGGDRRAAKTPVPGVQ